MATGRRSRHRVWTATMTISTEVPIVVDDVSTVVIGVGDQERARRSGSRSWASGRHRSGDHDGGGGLSVQREPVEGRLNLLHCGRVHLGDEAVLPSDPVALGDLGSCAASSARFGGCPGAGRMRTNAAMGNPTAAGSTSIRYPVITPARWRRCTRSVTAGADIP